MPITRVGVLPRQHRMFGNIRWNITDRLSRANWRERAVCRVMQDGTRLYIYVWFGYVPDGEINRRRYFVEVRSYPGGKSCEALERSFTKVDPALAYANGDSELGQISRPTRLREYPDSREAGYELHTFRRDDSGVLIANGAVHWSDGEGSEV